MTLYSITKGHRKIIDRFRGDTTYGQAWLINKNGVYAYEVTTSTLGDWCDCPGHTHHGKCKHVQMVYDAIADDEQNDVGE